MIHACGFFVSVREFVNLWLAFSASEPDAKKAWATGTARLNTRCQKGMGHRHSKTEHVRQSALQGVPVSKVSIGIACLFDCTWNLENLPYIIYSYTLIFLHEIHTAMQSSLSSGSNLDIKCYLYVPQVEKGGCHGMKK